jgi:hypothetical protein
VTAHVSTWSTKNCTSAHPRATQFATHAMLNWGGSCSSLMHWSAQKTISRQPMGWHWPQSAGQIEHVS